MKNLIGILCLLFLISCSSDFDKKLLEGTWEIKMWQENTSGKEIRQKMDFTFEAGERYSIDYGSETEKGKYWLMGSYLHTVEDGKAEKKVKILTLKTDTLILEMNRMGTLETAVLTK